MKVLLGLPLFIASLTVALPALGQSYGAWQSFGGTITAVGDGKTFVGDCTGKDVRLNGNNQTVTLRGNCNSVVSFGNNKHITLETAKSLTLTGNDNVVHWSKRPGSVNSTGNDNSMTGP